MRPIDDREQRQADLLWRYIEELKQVENPQDVHFVAVTPGESAELVGLMETAAEAHALLRREAAPGCRRQAVRQRLQEAIAGARPAEVAPPVAAEPRREGGRLQLPAWLTLPLTSRAMGWGAAAVALLALVWVASLRPPLDAPQPPAARFNHAQTIEVMPAIIAGRLDPESSRAAWEHLNHCQHCLEIYAAKWRAAQPARRTSHEGSHRIAAAPPRGPTLAGWSGTTGAFLGSFSGQAGQ